VFPDERKMDYPSTLLMLQSQILETWLETKHNWLQKDKEKHITLFSLVANRVQMLQCLRISRLLFFFFYPVAVMILLANSLFALHLF